MICAKRGRSHCLILSRSLVLYGIVPSGVSLERTASPSASASTPMRVGSSPSSMGVDATQMCPRQWLTTTLCCSGCLVTRRTAPPPRTSGMVRLLCRIAQLSAQSESVSSVDNPAFQDAAPSFWPLAWRSCGPRRSVTPRSRVDCTVPSRPAQEGTTWLPTNSEAQRGPRNGRTV